MGKSKILNLIKKLIIGYTQTQRKSVEERESFPYKTLLRIISYTFYSNTVACIIICDVAMRFAKYIIKKHLLVQLQAI